VKVPSQFNFADNMSFSRRALKKLQIIDQSLDQHIDKRIVFTQVRR